VLIAVGSVKGSPGVSTFCLALAARWPGTGRRVLVECDPAGGDLAARYGVPLSPGLLSLAAPPRGAAAAAGAGLESVWWHTQVLPGGLSVLVAPPGGEQTRAALATLTGRGAHPLVQAAADPGSVVIVDAGRLDAGSAALGLVRAADQLLLLSRATGSDLAHLAARLEEVQDWSERLGLLLVGDGYPDSEVTRELSLSVMARIPSDPVEAAALTGRIPPRRRPFNRATLSRTAAQVATVLATSYQPLSRPAPRTDADIPVHHEANSRGRDEPTVTSVSPQLLNGRRL